MKITRQGVEKLINAEISMANEQHPLFASDHEGLAVIMEERYEADQEFAGMWDAVEDLALAVYEDHESKNKKICAGNIAMIATELACEAIQVAAMAYKFTGSIIAREEKENE